MRCLVREIGRSWVAKSKQKKNKTQQKKKTEAESLIYRCFAADKIGFFLAHGFYFPFVFRYSEAEILRQREGARFVFFVVVVSSSGLFCYTQKRFRQKKTNCFAEPFERGSCYNHAQLV